MLKKKDTKSTLGVDKIFTGSFTEYTDYVCIPMTIDKKPAISWKGLIKTPEHKFLPEHNIAILTGKINQITVIDIDNPKPGKKENDGMKMYEELLDKYNEGCELETPVCITQSNGLHLYFKYDPDIKTTTGVNGYSVDIRNDGALIICPPSVGQKGEYEWKEGLSLHKVDVMEIPPWFKEWLGFGPKTQKIVRDKVKKIDSYVPNKENIFIYDEDNIYKLLKSLPSNYLSEYSDWIIITSCLKSEGLKDLWDRWSESSTSYDSDSNEEIWTSLEPKLNIYYLMIIAQKEGIYIDYQIIIRTKKINFMTKIPDTIINQKYLNKKCFDNTRTQIVKSNCGTGKTTLSAEFIKDLIEDRGYKILSLTVRVSLAYQQVKNFKQNKIKMDIYKDLDSNQLNKTNKLIIQIDSITKLDLMHWKNTIIYLDEVSALFSYILISTTLKDKRVEILNILIDLLNNASYVLCTDADVNDVVLTMFDKLKIKYHLIENTYKNIKDIKAIEYDNKEVLINKMQDLLLNDKKIICCFDSKAEMDLTVKRLKNFCEDNELDKQLNNFLIYSSAEGDEKDFLNINDKWKSKNIFFTPKITIGVSFDNKESRDVFLIARGNSINAFGYVQQISRCRNIGKLYYYVVKKYQYLKYDSPADVQEQYKDLLKDYKGVYHNIKPNPDDNINDDINAEINDINKLKTIKENNGTYYDYDTKEWKFNDSLYNNLFFIHEYHDHILRSAPREQLRWMLEAKGYQIKYNNQTIDDKEEKEIKKEIAECKEELVEDLDKMNHRALYNKESSLTDAEKKIREDAERRAKYLNINFMKKVDKEKYEEYLVDDKVFTHFCTYKLLMDSEAKLNQKIANELENDYCVMNAKSLLTKIKLIRQLEGILDIKTLEIDTAIDVERFDEEVEIKDKLKNTIKNTFRSNRNIEKDDFKNWYYQLIQMYRHILGGNIFNYKLARYDDQRYLMYTINTTIIDQYADIIKLSHKSINVDKKLFKIKTQEV
jgi:hypothetical protein